MANGSNGVSGAGAVAQLDVCALSAVTDQRTNLPSHVLKAMAAIFPFDNRIILAVATISRLQPHQEPQKTSLTQFVRSGSTPIGSVLRRPVKGLRHRLRMQCCLARSTQTSKQGQQRCRARWQSTDQTTVSSKTSKATQRGQSQLAKQSQISLFTIQNQLLTNSSIRVTLYLTHI